ncbi:MAG: hypothetical protein DI537_41250, partial [Stutzerimonas stutzeri]
FDAPNAPAEMFVPSKHPFSLDDLLANTILNTDSYKLGHFTFEDFNTTGDYAYIEARKGGDFTEVTFFGLQYFILYYMTKPVTMEMIDEAEAQVEAHGLPFNRAGWELIVTRHKGFMPVRIKAIREGETVAHGVVQVTIEATDPDIAWASRYVETALLRADWFGSTIAARSARWNAKLKPFLERTGSPETIAWKIVDFGARGSEVTESAAVAGAAHLLAVQVTDNQMGIRLARKAYPGSDEATGSYFMPAFSIPATEHSVTTAWTAPREYDFYENIIRVHGSKPRMPDGSRRLVSVVVDTYDQDQAISIWGTPTGQPLTLSYINPLNGETVIVEKQQGGLKKKLIDSNMALVARPDSGDPRINVPHLLNLLGKYFGFTMNAKGFKMLPDYVRVIQGDSIDEESLVEIAAAIEAAGWSLDNVNFGSGGGLLQKDVTRDTHRYAQKASYVVVDGEARSIQKLPKTDPTKASKAGRFAVVRRGGKLITVAEGALYEGEKDELEVVYENGVVERIMSFVQVRETSEASATAYLGIAA